MRPGRYGYNILDDGSCVMGDPDSPDLRANTDGAVTVRNGLTVTAGGLTVTAGDLTLTAGALAINGGNLVAADDLLVAFGTGSTARLSWDTTDANANVLMLQMPAGGAVDVPVLAIGQSIESVDLGLYNGVVDPRIAMFGVGAVTTGPVLEFRKARGTAAAPTVVTTGDDLGTIDFYGCVAAGAWVRAASIRVDMAGTIGATRGPGTITFMTATDAAPSVLTNALIINAGQGVTVANGLVVTAGGFLLSGGAFTVPVGSAAAPSIAFAGDSNTGLYWIGADNFGVTVNGAKTVDFAAGTTTFPSILNVGANGAGVDVKAFGGTASCYLEYDASEDRLNVIQTNAATTGVETTLSVQQTHTGVGASAEAFEAILTSNVALGNYANAIFGKIDFSTSGEVTGLAGVICAEVAMPATDAPAGGEYAAFEAEFNMAGASVNDRPIIVMEVNAWGAGVAEFDDHAYLFDIAGVTIDTNHFVQTETDETKFSHKIKCRVNGTEMFLMACAT